MEKRLADRRNYLNEISLSFMIFQILFSAPYFDNIFNLSNTLRGKLDGIKYDLLLYYQNRAARTTSV